SSPGSILFLHPGAAHDRGRLFTGNLFDVGQEDYPRLDKVRPVSLVCVAARSRPPRTSASRLPSDFKQSFMARAPARFQTRHSSRAVQTMITRTVVKIVYALFGTLYLVTGLAVLLVRTGFLPDAIRDIVLRGAEDDTKVLHVVQELGSLLI